MKIEEALAYLGGSTFATGSRIAQAIDAVLEDRRMHKRHAAELLDLIASLPAVPADAQETVDQIQRERDESD
ncbi:MAG: hypothetical protein AAF933_10540 [Pseudomonadota bacterium]